MLVTDIGFDDQSEQLLVTMIILNCCFDLQGNFLSETKVDDLYERWLLSMGKSYFHNKLEGVFLLSSYDKSV